MSGGVDLNEPHSRYDFAVVAFAGAWPAALSDFVEGHPAVAAVVSLDRADQGSPRVPWLRRRLASCSVPPGRFAVVGGVGTDDEVDELVKSANATVFQVGPEPPPGIRQPLPLLFPDEPDSFLGCLQACVDPLAAYGPAVLAGR